jgi:DNA polymerase-1
VAPAGDAERLQQAFAEYVMHNRGVMHGGQADLATVYPRDPEELLGRWAIDDTMVMAYLIGEPVIGLKPLTAKYLGRHPIENDREWADMPVRFTARYAAAGDTRNTYDLYFVLRDKLAEMGKQVSIYEDIERPLIPRVASMERGGVAIDIPGLLKQHWEAVVDEESLRRAVLIAYGYDLRSDECTRAFIVSQGLPDPGTLDQRVISLSEHWVIDVVLLYRQTRTRRRNFLGATLKKWAEAGMPKVFYLHPHFNQCGSMDDEDKIAPRSGRFSSSGPNIQQQPRAIRSIFVAPPDHLWWSFDYSGLELRLAAAISGDPEMWRQLTEPCPDEKCGHFPKHGDMHSGFQFKIHELTGQMLERPHVKTGNFEQLYFGGDEQMMKILAKQRAFITRETAHVISSSHKVVYAGYHTDAERVRRVGKERGYAETLAGRRRYIPELNSNDSERVGYGERACVNHGIQGTGADIVKQAMNDLTLVLRKYGAHLALQVHDELDGWVHKDVDVKAFEAEVKAVMQQTINGMLLLVEGGTANGTARTWEEAH